MKRILFVCKKRIDSYGKSFGLLNSATFVSDFLNHTGYQSKVVTVNDSNDIDRVVTKHNPTHVVIEAIFVPASKFTELLAIPRHKKRTQIVRLHSKLPFLANEGIAFPWLVEYAKIARLNPNFIIAPNSEQLTHELHHTIHLHTVYLPNVYMESEPPNSRWDIKHHPHHVDIGCFGAIRPMKNTLIQAVAAIKFAKRIGRKLIFHINGDRVEQNGGQVFKNLVALFNGSDNCELRCHPWMSHKEFLKLICTMDIGMQVSYSETFNIVTADFVSMYIPVVVSKEVSWVSSMFHANPNSSDDIANKLNFTYKVGKIYLPLVNNVLLQKYNRDAKREWMHFLV